MSAPGHGLYLPQTEHDACGVAFVAHIKGQKSRQIVQESLEILTRLSHRAAVGSDPLTGDGAGILLQLPHRFFKAVGLELGFDLPRRRRYGLAMVFLPSRAEARAACERIFEEAVVQEGQRVLGWRDVPTDPSQLGPTGAAVQPVIRQLYIGRRRVVPSAFERKLYVIRKLAENRIRAAGVDPDGRFHVASCSSETVVYKGLLLPDRLDKFYLDLRHERMVSALALVHSRFSTNTLPTWDLAQPFHHAAHNGEINTLRGNRNWMNARRSLLQSAKFVGGLDRLFPIIVPGKSDSAQFDNMLELLFLGGRSLPHAAMMMIPEAWEDNELMAAPRRAFYEYSSALMEAWDGPSAICFTDGHLIGATLDRNGLRPARYLVTGDERVILASEVGVIDIPAGNVVAKGRLQPGKMFIVDTQEGCILDDEQVKQEIIARYPYSRWLKKNLLSMHDFPLVEAPERLTGSQLVRLQRALGYADEDLRLVIAAMANAGKEPTGSMGNDTPVAVLSAQAPRLSSYFHQLFAQVTNPPIDPIREKLVMSLRTHVGGDGNTFEETPDQCHRLALPGPILTNGQLAKISSIREGVFEPLVVSICYPAADGPEGLSPAVDRLCAAAVDALDDGLNVLILSDRNIDSDNVAIPALLALSAVHQHLVREGIRLQTGLVLETADAFEVHDFACLIGFGAAAVNPWLALDSVRDLASRSEHGVSFEGAQARYIRAIELGLLKVMSKMGISTIASYRGAQIFESLGIDADVIERHFSGTAARLGGVDLRWLGAEVLARHRRGFGPELPQGVDLLPVGGRYAWRRDGEAHRWHPDAIAALQQATRNDDPAAFARYVQILDEEDDTTLRGLLELVQTPAPVPLIEVEPVEGILRRFVTGAMSFGSISAEAHETLAIAMNRIGGRSNSGEGGEELHRNEAMAGGDSRASRIRQVASGRFGVTTRFLAVADDLQIKMAQGAKPGEGGQLPGHKVDARIAAVRCATPGVTLISPPPHHDIYSIEDLKQLIFDLQAVNPKARISVKLVSEVGVGTIAAGVAKAGAGCVIISGWSGGTGASPLSSIKHAGLPWELGLAEAQQVLVRNGLRERVRLQVDGGLRTPRDVVVAALFGAEEFGVATAALIAEGCVLLRKCHLNTCSMGIATQDPALRARFSGRPEHVVRLFTMLAEGVRQWMARLGFRTVDEMVGRVERLRARQLDPDSKAATLDLQPLLVRPWQASALATTEPALRCTETDPGTLAEDTARAQLDRRILDQAATIIDGGGQLELRLPVRNADRAVGAMLSGEIARRRDERKLVDDSIVVHFTGSAGQSFAAFLLDGVSFHVEGDTNDYLAKGLCGGRVAVFPPKGSRFVAEDNVIVGNTVLYGATAGELYVRGLAGERFAVRNSGARAVVEGVGDHGCEYMTGGVVVVLGPTGRNFAAGMSGGVAYVFDRDRQFARRCNQDMVDLEPLADASDRWLVHGLIDNHVRHTDSTLGRRILDNWQLMSSAFVKVMPTEYRRALARQRAAERRQAG